MLLKVVCMNIVACHASQGGIPGHKTVLVNNKNNLLLLKVQSIVVLSFNCMQTSC